MNEMKKNTDINTIDTMNKLNRCTCKLFDSVSADRALTFGSASKAANAGWSYHMAEFIERAGYLNAPEKPALESVVDSIEQAYRKQHRSELGLKVMLEECFTMTNWYQTLYSQYESFKEEHARDLTCINRDLLLTLEAMLSICVNSYYQFAFVTHLKESVDELNWVVAQAAEQ